MTTADIPEGTATRVSTKRFAWPVRAIHWLSALLILVAYLSSELAEEIEEGGRAGVDWHVLAGTGLLLLFVPRLIARAFSRTPPIAPAPPSWSLWPGRLVTLALLLFVVVQPLLGALTVWSEGHALAIPLTAWSLPPPFVFGEDAGKFFEDAHVVVGNAFYAVIAAHALAALWHHFFRRDNALRRML
jgi:superoxide oxidase